MYFVKFTQFTKPEKKEQMVVRFSVRTDYTEFVGLCWCYVFITIFHSICSSQFIRCT